MHKTAWSASLLIILLLMPLASPIEVINAASNPEGAISRTLFLHTNNAIGMFGGRIMNTSRVFGGLQRADITYENNFYLYPALAGALHITGTVLFKLWLRADASTAGTINIALSEATLVGVKRNVCTMMSPVWAENQTKEFIFAVGAIDYVFTANSTLQFNVAVRDAKARIFLHWDDPTTPSQVIIPCVDYAAVRWVKTYDPNGIERTLFSANETKGQVEIWIRADITNSFGGCDLGLVNVTILNKNNVTILSGQGMLISSGTPASLTNVYQYRWVTDGLAVGTYTILVNAFDQGGNRVSGSGRFSLSYYYKLQCQALDANGQRMVNANVTIIQGPVIAWSGRTDSTGWITCTLASSVFAGTYGIITYWKGTPVNSTSNLNLSSSISLQLKCNVYDFTLIISDQKGKLLQDVEVQLLRDSSILASGRTSSDGIVKFIQIPIGRYGLNMTYEAYNYKLYDILIDQSKTQNVTLTIPTHPPPPPVFDFSLQASPTSLTVMPGQNVTYSINIWVINGTAETITFRPFSELPSGCTYTFTPNSGNPPFTSRLVMNTTSTTPPGNYTLTVTAAGGGKIHSINVELKVLIPPPPPPPPSDGRWILYLILAMSIVGTVGAIGIVRIRRRIYPTAFNYFNTLTNGGIPASSIVMIFGNPGCGKTVLAKQLMHESLKRGRSCIFITNTDFPSKIRTSMTELGLETESYETKRRLIFIDSYSETAGKTSTEKYSVPSITDLTGLGVKISASLSELGDNTDVFLDSLSPLFMKLKLESILTFIQTIGAKVKGQNGSFYFTMGTGVEEEFLTKLDESSDCVIELQVVEAGGAQQRKLRVKKMRGSYVAEWVTFSVEPAKGIIFYTPKKPR